MYVSANTLTGIEKSRSSGIRDFSLGLVSVIGLVRSMRFPTATEGTAAALTPAGLEPAVLVGNGDGALAWARNLFGMKPFVAASI